MVLTTTILRSDWPELAGGQTRDPGTQLGLGPELEPDHQPRAAGDQEQQPRTRDRVLNFDIDTVMNT